MNAPPIPHPSQIAARNALEQSSTDNGRKKRSVGNKYLFWPNASKLRIGFVDEDLSSEHKQMIINAINQWQAYVNLRFEFIDGRKGTPGYQKGDIRITTQYDKNWSLLGTTARVQARSTPTMSLGVKPSDPKFVSTVMHEFGHALGADHEHQHPYANIPWDVPKVYAFYASKGYSAEVVDAAVLTKRSVEDALTLPYDRLSIMHYPVDNALTLGDWEVGTNLTLSEKDKAFMALAYPRD